jgi:nitrogen regulatory protein PII
MCWSRKLSWDRHMNRSSSDRYRNQARLKGNSMYLLKANVPTASVHELALALMGLGVTRIRVVEVTGYTDGIEQERVYRGTKFLLQLLPEHEVEALIPSETVDEAIDMIISTVRRQHGGDGFISVAPVEKCYRISTGHPQI